ncbi:MAG: WG repeat-containing protein [Bacteroidetes bacterium]|nr:WG repeat-containing protein [Bacteroidota bacterium]
MNTDFSYDLIPVEINGKWGYIDKIGNYVINPQFTIAQLFKEDLAIVANEDSLLGYIDKKGNYVIKPSFIYATNFNDGLAFTTRSNGHITCIDKKGKVKFTLTDVESASEFSENFAVVSVAGKYGYIDNTGKYIIKPQFDYAANFNEGLAKVGKYNKGSDSGSDFSDLIYGFIDKKGNLKINYQFKDADNFSEGLATVSILDNEYGIINSDGKYVVYPKYGYIQQFKEGLATFNLSQDGGVSSNKGFIDKEGKIAINPQYDDTSNFNNSLAPIRVGNKYGYIDKKGKYVINPQFESASIFFSGIAAVKIAGKIGFINERGEYLVNPQYNKTFSSAFNDEIFLDGRYMGNFDFVESDYYDTSKMVKKLFNLSNKLGLFGLYKNEKLGDIIRDNVFNNLKYGSEPTQIINDDLIPLSDEITITNVIMDFSGFTYLNTLKSSDFYFYNYQKNTKININTNAELFHIDVYLQLTSSAINKEQIISESIQKELKKRYDIETIYEDSSKSFISVGVDNLEITFHFNSIENTFD